MTIKKHIKKKVTKKKETKKPSYLASINVLGKDYTAEGETASEAIENLEVRNAKGKGILTVSLGKESRMKILTHVMVSKLFSMGRTPRIFALKNISMMFDL